MDVPSNGGEITTAWLTWALRSCKAVTTASVKSCTIEVVGAEKGITGELVRLGIGYDRDEPGAPGHLIAKFSSPLPEARALLQSMGFYEREVRFYQELAGSTPLRTPRCHFGHVDAASGLSMLLLEDLAPARNGDSVQTFSLGEVTRVLEALAALHAGWWRSSSVAAKRWLRLKAMAAPETMATVFAKSWPFFLDKLSVPHTPDILDAGRWILRELGHAADVLFLQEPRTLIHNDVQGDNLFFDDAGGIVALVDWQLTTCARPVVDVASLIRGQLDPGPRRQHEQDLVQAYHEALVQRGVTDYPLNQCWQEYQLATVLRPARLASAVGLHPGLQAHQGAFWDVIFPRLM